MHRIFQRRQTAQCTIDHTPPRCSFCDKPRQEGTRLIAGLHGAFICEHCVRRCNAILGASELTPQVRQ